MRIDNPSREQLSQYYERLDEQVALSGALQWVKYLDLGTRMVRLINYSVEFTPHVEKQLGYVLRDAAERYDATLVIWQEKNFDTLIETFVPLPRLRIEKLLSRFKPGYWVFDQELSRHHPLIHIDVNTRIANAWNPESNTYYYGVADLTPEEFIKQGHIFVQIFNKLLKSPRAGLVHGAAVGLDGKGILLCARGQRGKSTLAVRAMLDGFDYVSDDYLVLGKEESGLYAWPIYSIITLSAMMWGDLYKTLDAKFVSNNARKDKYVFNIGNYHQRFVSRYPIQCGMFTQIVADPEPNIVQCTQAGKGRAIVQLVHSTIAQMGDQHDTATISKIIDFVRDLPFYQINLCRDINKNLRYLRDFLKTGTHGQQINHAGMLHSRSIPGQTI
jgi:hypothetical protein